MSSLTLIFMGFFHRRREGGGGEARRDAHGNGSDRHQGEVSGGRREERCVSLSVNMYDESTLDDPFTLFLNNRGGQR